MPELTREIGVVGFALASLACVMAGAVRWRRGRGGAFWFAAALLLAVLAFDVPLHFRFELTDWFRGLAQRGQWYEMRRPVQAGVLVTLLGLVVAALPWLIRRLCRCPAELSLAIAGLAVVLGVYVVEVVSLHQAQRVLYIELGPGMLIAWGWLAGALLVAAGAIRTLRTNWSGDHEGG